MAVHYGYCVACIQALKPSRYCRVALTFVCLGRICKGEPIGPYRSLILWLEDFINLKRSDPPLGWTQEGNLSVEYSHRLVCLVGRSCLFMKDLLAWTWLVDMTASASLVGRPGNSPETVSQTSDVILMAAMSMHFDIWRASNMHALSQDGYAADMDASDGSEKDQHIFDKVLKVRRSPSICRAVEMRDCCVLSYLENVLRSRSYALL